MLGGFSPYRGGRFPQGMSCFECGAIEVHYAHECPSRFVRVRGEPPPGWKITSSGVVKDPEAWNGGELTENARLKYRDFILKYSLAPHRTHPITIAEITGSSPPDPRLPDGLRGNFGRRP